jgi:hypothetical protein
VGEERHAVIDLALRYLGLGAPTVVEVDDQGRMRPDALSAALGRSTGPSIVCLQAGNLHSGAFDPIGELTALAHERAAWVHVDGAFGLWAAASPLFRERLAGLDTADSWATDAHKTLNVPYDCGMAIVSRPEVMRSTFGVHTSYLVADDPARATRTRRSPSCRAAPAGCPCGRPCGHSVDPAPWPWWSGWPPMPVPSAEELIDEGAAWMSGSRWHGRNVLRVSASNWATNAEDVAQSIAAVERAVAAASRAAPEDMPT